MSELPPSGDILTSDGWVHLRLIVERELARRNLPGHITDDTVHLLTPGGTPMLFGLVPLARRLRHCDEREWPGIVGGELDQVDLGAGPPDIHSMPDPSGALKAQIRPRGLLEANPTMEWTPWWPGLLSVLMVDHGEFARSLGRDELDRFDEDRGTLERLARRNVAAMTPARMLVPGDRSSFVMLTGDLFTTTHALWPARYCSIEPERGVLIGLPTRNCVLLAPLRRGFTRRAVGLLAGLVDLAFHNEAGPVTTSLYWTSGTDEDPNAVEIPVTGSGTGSVEVRVPRDVSDRMI